MTIITDNDPNGYQINAASLKLNGVDVGGASDPTVSAITYNNGGTSTINCALSRAFSLTANGTSTTLAMSNVPVSGTEVTISLHLTWASGTITKPASWSKGDTFPTATGNYTFTIVTVDGGTSWILAVMPH